MYLIENEIGVCEYIYIILNNVICRIYMIFYDDLLKI